MRVSRDRASKRQINETKLRRKADGRAFALAGMRSADLWPSAATRGPPGSAPMPAGLMVPPPPPQQQQPAAGLMPQSLRMPYALGGSVAALGPPPPQKRKAEEALDLRQKLGRMQ